MNADYNIVHEKLDEALARVKVLEALCAQSANALDDAITCIIEGRDLPDNVLRAATEAMMALHRAALGGAHD